MRLTHHHVLSAPEVPDSPCHQRPQQHHLHHHIAHAAVARFGDNALPQRLTHIRRLFLLRLLGRIRRRFTVDMTGELEADTLRLALQGGVGEGDVPRWTGQLTALEIAGRARRCPRPR